MKEKKNIDDIFAQGFKDFEATPSPHVWKNIQAALEKEKKERKVIPLWMKLGGVAALVALLLTVGNAVYNFSNEPPASVTQENIITHPRTDLENPSPEVEKQAGQSQIASEENKLQHDQHAEKSPVNASHNHSQVPYSNVNSADASKRDKTDIASSPTASKYTGSIAAHNLKTETEEAVSVSKNSQKEKAWKDSKPEDGAIINRDKNILEDKNEAVVNNGSPEKNSGKSAEEISKEQANKKSIFDAIAENDQEDESEAAQPQKNPAPERRWNVSPHVAPVYYSSLGNGSSIDPAFSDNPQKGDVNMSYGIQVSYALNNRLSVRTGISNVDLSYSTAGIEIGTGPVAVALRSVDYGSREVVVTAVDKGTLASSNASNGFGDIMPKSTKGEARVVQNINYYEVPVELKYAVVNRKVGVNVIGGLSTLFLGNNEISVKADDFNSVLGEANNLSSISFSTNIGLGLDYKLSRKFTFNIEPMFKYQLNPYTNSSVNYKPYYLGVYSGFSFRF